jgi:hypothetical protein
VKRAGIAVALVLACACAAILASGVLHSDSDDAKPSSPAAAAVGFYRQLGFFRRWRGLSDAQILARVRAAHEKEWDEKLDPRMGRDFDLFLMSYDHDRVWWEDTEQDVVDGNDAYVGALKAWSRISRGAFMPTAVRERWSPRRKTVEISFLLAGEQESVTASIEDDFLDVDVLGQINALIPPSGPRFHVQKPFDQTAFVVAMRDDEARYVNRERSLDLIEAGR